MQKKTRSYEPPPQAWCRPEVFVQEIDQSNLGFEPLDLFAAVGWRQCVTIDHRNACSGWVSARALSADDTKVCSIPRLCCGRLTMQCEPTPSAALESCSPRSAQEIENYHESRPAPSPIV